MDRWSARKAAEQLNGLEWFVVPGATVPFYGFKGKLGFSGPGVGQNAIPRHILNADLRELLAQAAQMALEGPQTQEA